MSRLGTGPSSCWIVFFSSLKAAAQTTRERRLFLSARKQTVKPLAASGLCSSFLKVCGARKVSEGSMGSPTLELRSSYDQRNSSSINSASLGLFPINGALLPPLEWKWLSPQWKCSCLSKNYSFKATTTKHWTEMHDFFFLKSTFTLAVLWVKEASYINMMQAEWVRKVKCSTLCIWVELWLSEVSQYFRLECCPEKRA